MGFCVSFQALLFNDLNVTLFLIIFLRLILGFDEVALDSSYFTEYKNLLFALHSPTKCNVDIS